MSAMTTMRLLLAAASAWAMAVSAAEARFLQADPVGYTADMNVYEYVLSDPLNRTDPTGLRCEISNNGGHEVANCHVDYTINYGNSRSEQARATRETNAVNRAYTRAVQRLLDHPNAQRSISVNVGNGQTRTFNITAGAVAHQLAGRYVTLSGNPRDSLGATVPESNATTVSYGRHLAEFPNASANALMRQVEITFGHEGIHGSEEEFGSRLTESQLIDPHIDHGGPYDRVSQGLIFGN